MPEETQVVVVDDPDLAGLYAGGLREEEYAVRIAHDERAALAAADEADAVVLRDSPNLSPETLLNAFDGRDAEVPTIVVTDDADHGTSTAADARLVEPVSVEALRDAVSGLLACRAYSRGIRELFSVASERAAIESGREEGSDERRRELDERLDELRDRLDERLDSVVETGGFAAAYRAAGGDEEPDDA
ncbi:MAG: HalX domain-containing protein [Haloferacaceae archaeon]